MYSKLHFSKLSSQQEARIARAVEIMLMYVDNLKRNCEREHTELEESRKLLAANNLSVEDQWVSQILTLLALTFHTPR